MKKLILFTLITLTGIVACQEEKFDQHDPSVEQFIALLVEGEYDRNEPLPQFRPEQVPALLRYADDNQAITSFPVNPLSSSYASEFRLGECLLWTIESIRVSYGQTTSLISPARYPSLNPVLINEASQRPDRRTTEAELHLGYQAYYDWWYDDLRQSFEQKRNINPLATTTLTWR